MTVLVGTSGWHYRVWKGRFYPTDLPAREWLGYYAARFATVEVNNAFYRLPPSSTFAGWRDATPADFVVAVKASRYLTHIKRLKDPREPVRRLMERASELGDSLGPVLMQLPPTMTADADSLDAALRCFPQGTRVAVEVRHPSWLCDEIRGVLERRGAAWCLADGGPVRLPLWRTTEWCYMRFHRGGGLPEHCYTRSPLHTWAGRLAALCGDGADVYCYFNNDPHGCAVRDARRFASALRSAGLSPTRVPGVRETPVG